MSQTHKTVRTVHLYLGMSLLPLVFMFGFTGFLFNHPTLFSSLTGDRINGGEYPQAFEQAIPDIESLSTTLVDGALSDHRILSSRFSGSFILRAREIGSGLDHRLQIQPEAGSIKRLVFDAQRPDPLFSGELNSPQLEGLESGLQTAFQQAFADQGFRYDEVRVQSIPRLVVESEDANGQRITTQWNLSDGSYEARPPEQTRAAGLTRMMKNLHQTLGFQPDWAHWESIWAVLSDIMAFSMMTWAITGLILWYKTRRRNRWLGIAPAVSLILISFLGLQLYQIGA